MVDIPSYLKDTNDFLDKIKQIGPLPPKTIMFTLDVVSLYTNIPHEDGLEATRLALEKRINPTIQTSVLIKLLEIILRKNCFTYDGNFYRQRQGTAMGTQCAPSYANICMSYVEQKAFTKQTKLPKAFWRFIDDVFGLWTYTEDALLQFMDIMNKIHPTIKFTLDYSTVSLSFLDVTVYLSDDGKLSTDLYKKETDTGHYLEYNSMHPPHCKDSIVYSQTLRLKRICDKENTFAKRTKELQYNLKQCGYKKRKVSEDIEKAVVSKNGTVRKSDKPTERLPFIIEYNDRLPNVRHLIKELWPICQISNTFKNMPPPIVSYKRAPNLRDLLVHAEAKSKNKETTKPAQKNHHRLLRNAKLQQKPQNYKMWAFKLCYV